MVKKLSRMPYAQACVIVEDNRVALVSYRTTVAVIEDGKLTVNGLYSMTTRKHIGAFMAEYTNGYSFQTAKILAQTGDTLDLVTGEIITR